MTEPTYPASSAVTAGQPTAADHYNNLRKDALNLGALETDSVKLASLLSRYQTGISIVYLATARLRIPFSTTNPPTLMINGYMCRAAANIDLASNQFSGGADTWYIFAVRETGSTTFTLAVNISASEAIDSRIIGEVIWTGAALSTITVYTDPPLPLLPPASLPAVANYDSGWFAVAYDNVYSKAHGLGVPPRIVFIWHSANGGTDELVQLLVNYYTTTSRSAISVDATNVYLACGNSSASGVIYSNRRSSAGGYARIYAWL